MDAKEESEDEKVQEKKPPAEVKKITVDKTNVNGLPMISGLPDELIDKENKKEEEEKETKKILDEEEANEVMSSPNFDYFFSKAARLMERGLNSEDDIIGSFERLETDDYAGAASKDDKIIEKATFMKENPIKRAITNIEWSPKYKDLFLCSYYKSENDWDAKETDGLVNIFSTKMPEKPELTLTCSSEITSCIFHPIEPYLIIGGTYSGNVILWDMREKRNYPTAKSQISTSSMIKGISVVGSKNANNIVTVSNNGAICVWSTNMMKEPQKRVDLGIKTNEIPVHCIDFPEEETNEFYIGGEDFNIYSAKIYTKKQNEENITDVYSAHLGTVFSLHYHPKITERKSKASDFLLSTSADWGIGLWHPKSRKDPVLLIDGEVEYYDAQWSPVHPSVFATCNGNGQIDIWDIAKETEESRYRFEADKRAVNKIRWSSDGKKLLTGNSNGVIKMYNVAKEFYQPREDDLAKLEHILNPPSF